jgi:prepilin-type N-terminal cleavage/methylation domain-containing protein
MKFILRANLESHHFNPSPRGKPAHFPDRERSGKGCIAIRSTSGFSLMELLITITIMALVIAISTLSFNTWQAKSKFEAQIRELFSDISEARTNAFTQKIGYRIEFQPSNYVMKSYSTENEPKNAGRTIKDKKLKYGLTLKTGSDLAVDITDHTVDFDSRGFASKNFTVIVNPLTVDSALNCLVVFVTRTNMGKINGTTCEFR